MTSAAMQRFVRLLLTGLIVLVLFGAPTTLLAKAPEIVSVERIWNQGPHNAFTDLARFKEQWYCCFRESEGHVGGDGRIRVLVSDDGQAWRSAALLTEEGIDLRDPKFSVTADGRLMIVAGGSVYRGTKTLQGRRPRVAFSADGVQWSDPRPVMAEGDWLWRVTWHEGRAYGVSYSIGSGASTDWTLTLVASDDGVDYQPITQLEVPDRANETTLRFLEDGRMMALVRREGGNRTGWIGTSRAPYEQWQWRETKHRLGGPDFIRLPDGRLFAGTRFYAGNLNDPSVPGCRTVLARMDHDKLEPVLAMPSGGDTSYPGMVFHDGLLWFSYYSSHEGRSSIYLAKIRL